MKQFLVLTCVILLACSEVKAKRHKHENYDTSSIHLPYVDGSGVLQSDYSDSLGNHGGSGGSGDLDGLEGPAGFPATGKPEDWESSDYSYPDTTNGDWAGSRKVITKKLKKDIKKAKNLNMVSRRANN